MEMLNRLLLYKTGAVVWLTLKYTSACSIAFIAHMRSMVGCKYRKEYKNKYSDYLFVSAVQISFHHEKQKKFELHGRSADLKQLLIIAVE